MFTRLPSILSLAALLLGGCAPGGVVPIPGAPTAPTSYPGFDTWRYPGDDFMNTWRQASPYRWVGLYLPAPCHRDASFSGRRDFLTRTGWGIAVIYVGQQTFDGQTPAEITETTVCSSLLLTAERGGIDGRDAIQKTEQEGFPRGSIIYLDVERMERVTPQMVEYYQAWMRTVVSDGRYRAGTYAHVANAAALYNIAQNVYQQAGLTESVPFWIAGGRGFSLDAAPEAVGYRFAHIWQGVLDVTRTWGGRSLQIDENVARRPSPSAPPGQ
jgi:hypothetical protein